MSTSAAVWHIRSQATPLRFAETQGSNTEHGVTLIRFSRNDPNRHIVSPPPFCLYQTWKREREADEWEAEMNTQKVESRSEKPFCVKCCICINTIKNKLQQHNSNDSNRVGWESAQLWGRPRPPHPPLRTKVFAAAAGLVSLIAPLITVALFGLDEWSDNETKSACVQVWVCMSVFSVCVCLHVACIIHTCVPVCT